MSTGIAYELFTRQIFDQIVNQNSVSTIAIQHNVILQGAKTTHQIDVYWEFEVGGVKYATAVQAKDWANPVNQGELIKFNGVLEDIPGQPRGIFVTKTGYQAGARKFANECGILLYELREASEEDLKNRIKTIVITLVSYAPHASGFNLILDNVWHRNEKERLNIAPNDTFSISIAGMPNEIVFTDITGAPLTNVEKILHSFYPSNYKELEPTLKTHTFSEDTFVITGDARFPKVKVKGLGATVSVSRAEDEIQLGGVDIVRFILRNIVDNSERLFDEDMNLLK